MLSSKSLNWLTWKNSTLYKTWLMKWSFSDFPSPINWICCSISLLFRVSINLINWTPLPLIYSNLICHSFSLVQSVSHFLPNFQIKSTLDSSSLLSITLVSSSFLHATPFLLLSWLYIVLNKWFAITKQGYMNTTILTFHTTDTYAIPNSVFSVTIAYAIKPNVMTPFPINITTIGGASVLNLL